VREGSRPRSEVSQAQENIILLLLFSLLKTICEGSRIDSRGVNVSEDHYFFIVSDFVLGAKSSNIMDSM
jgi:hypothetical protein